jgi:hypothetical protein
VGKLPFISKSDDEIRQDFIHAYERLVRAGRAFDNGQPSEAPRIATEVDLFVYDHGRKTTSLLTHLGRHKIQFVNTAKALNPNNLLTETPLVMAHVTNSGFEYIALKGDGPPHYYEQAPQQFAKWWEKGVLRNLGRRVYSRKNLIHFFRNMAGGGHVTSSFQLKEENTAQDFADLSRTNTGGLVFSDGKNEYVPQFGPEYATVRQIGWELEQTLRNSCADLISNAQTSSSAGPRMKKV